MPKRVLFADPTARASKRNLIELLVKSGDDVTDVMGERVLGCSDLLASLRPDIFIIHLRPLAQEQVANVPREVRRALLMIGTRSERTRLVAVSDGPDFVAEAWQAGAHLAKQWDQLQKDLEQRPRDGPEKSAGDHLWDMCYGAARERTWQELLRALVPLHISLQAFFAIDCAESYGQNDNAFLLAPQADWDFYTAIFDRFRDEHDSAWEPESVGEPRWSSEDESQAYRVRPLLELIDEVFPEESAFDSNLKSRNLLRNEDLLTLCALLANTTDYKGRYKSKRDALLGGLGFVCPEHSKFPSADDRPGEQYAHLVQQLRLWSQSRARAEAVVRTMESLLQLGPALGRDSP